MARTFHVVTPAEARAAIATQLAPVTVPATLGEITLAPHQRAAARQVLRLLDTRGGALLADDVGLGKTFVALAVAHRYSSILVVAPAALCAMWKRESARAGVCIGVASYEALSRGSPPPAQPHLLVLDEAHHARSPKARRYAPLAALATGADTLLLSATPIPNRLAELRALFALFLGESVDAISEHDLKALIVRRTAATVPGAVLPLVLEPRWIDVADDSGCLTALERMPPPVPPADGGDGGALLRFGLVRQWASSRAALRGALRRRLARACALEDSLRTGRLPTAAELAGWQCDGEVMQLGFPELLASPVPTGAEADALLCAVSTHMNAVAALLSSLDQSTDPDADRAARLLDVRTAHPGERILCFTSFAETAEAYWRHLRSHASVARLTAAGGMIASGPLDRGEVLARFAPHGQRRAPCRSIEQVTLLIATDILAEGLDLRDATVVVHLDLPWSPARLAQRVGRARRLGSDACAITVYAMRPPAPTELVLSVETRLRGKAVLAWRAVGGAPDVLLPRSGDDPVAGSASEAERMSHVIDVVTGWDVENPSAAACRAHAGPDELVVAAVRAPVSGWLGVVDTGDRRRLVARIGAEVGDDVGKLELAIGLAARGDEAPSEIAVGAAAEAAADALRHAGECTAESTVGPDGHGMTIRRDVLRRVARVYAAAGPSRRAAVGMLAARARTLAALRLTAGLERQLRELRAARLDEESWLGAVAELAAPQPKSEAGDATVRALVVFVPQ